MTGEIARAWGLELTVLPVTDDRLRTMLTLADAGDEIAFQDYFVRRRHDVAVSAVRVRRRRDGRRPPPACSRPSPRPTAW